MDNCDNWPLVILCLAAVHVYFLRNTAGWSHELVVAHVTSRYNLKHWSANFYWPSLLLFLFLLLLCITKNLNLRTFKSKLTKGEFVCLFCSNLRSNLIICSIIFGNSPDLYIFTLLRTCVLILGCCILPSLHHNSFLMLLNLDLLSSCRGTTSAI